jgi:hypothetical protein
MLLGIFFAGTVSKEVAPGHPVPEGRSIVRSQDRKRSRANRSALNSGKSQEVDCQISSAIGAQAAWQKAVNRERICRPERETEILFRFKLSRLFTARSDPLGQKAKGIKSLHCP